MRRSIPVRIEAEWPKTCEEAEYADPVGSNAARGCLVIVLAALVALATVWYLVGRPENRPAVPGTPAPSTATPSPHGTPPSNWRGVDWAHG